MKERRTPNLYLLGAAYGLGWTFVTMFLEAWMKGNFMEFLDIRNYAFYLAFVVTTTTILTRLSGGWLAKGKPWRIIPCGLILPMAAILILALMFVLFMGGLPGLNPMAYFGTVWMIVIPITMRDLHWLILALALLNCWDLRRRMMQTPACPQPSLALIEKG